MATVAIPTIDFMGHDMLERLGPEQVSELTVADSAREWNCQRTSEMDLLNMGLRRFCPDPVSTSTPGLGLRLDESQKQWEMHQQH